MNARAGTVAVILAATAFACSGGGDGGGGTEALLIDAPGVETEIELLAPAEHGAGKIPTFEWRRVKGASGYRLAVLDERGGARWAWQGTETSVVLGGVVDRPEKGEAGAIITAGARWSVLAFDDEGHVMAVSRLRDVSP